MNTARPSNLPEHSTTHTDRPLKNDLRCYWFYLFKFQHFKIITYYYIFTFTV